MADELMVITLIRDRVAARRSYEIVAQRLQEHRPKAGDISQWLSM
jgi:hypothetical protein